jgi:formamidopyrimidine-DNA glycosylase
MPELPEVERHRRLAERVAVGRHIVEARCADDPIVVAEVTPRALERTLRGRRVAAAWRHGKQLWLELDRPPHLLIHFGMTGALHTPGERDLVYAAGIAHGSDWPPRFTKLDLTFDDGGRLAFTNARRLGRLRLRDRPREEPPISELGFDPLLDLPSPKAFALLCARRRVPVKAALLDQRLFAGVGNWIADEVLYQARIDPRRLLSELDPSELRRLRTKLRYVVAKAVEVDADKERLPKTWLFHHRWGKARDAVTARGERIEHLEIAGRTTAWVPSAQR